MAVWLGAITFIWALGMSETYQKTILSKQKSEKGARQPGLPLYGGQDSNFLLSLKGWMSTTMGRPLVMLLTEAIVLCFGLYVALSFGILYNFFAAVPLSLGKAYGFDDGQSGLVFVAISVGCLLATVTAVSIDSWVMRKRRSSPPSSHFHQPESILFPSMLGSFGLPVGLFWFGWTARQDIHWASPVCALGVFAWGNLCIFVSNQSCLLLISTTLTLSS